MRLTQHCVVAAAAIFCSLPALGQPKTDDPAAQIRALHWVDHGNVKFSASTSTLSLAPGYYAVSGPDATRFDELNNAQSAPGTEGVILSPDHSVIYLRWYASGYVTLDDWADLDADAMITEVRRNTEDANAAALAKGLKPIHVTGWIQKPTLDRMNNTAYWSFRARHDDGSTLVNAVALQLGRYGYNKLIWAGDAETFASSNSLPLVMQGHTFDSGARYADHVDTDKAAGYGIAALIGAAVGAKALKFAAGAGLLILLKKFILVPIVLAGLFFKKIAARFRRKPTAE
jgi:uncharacterized membrane-anchored protein